MMRKTVNILIGLFLIVLSGSIWAAPSVIIIETQNIGLVYKTKDNGRLYQSYLGQKFQNREEYNRLPTEASEAYIPSGTTNLFEPAIQMLHNDGNPSLDLIFTKSETTSVDENITSTTIWLKDPVYPVEVALHFWAYRNEDIIKTWTEITHHEKNPVLLSRFASSVIHVSSTQYWLSQFHGDWASEVRMEENKLTSGIKVIDSKLGTRENMYQTPMFFLSCDKLSDEVSGELIAGTLAWSGNFQLLFEVDKNNSLRIISGMNPFASEYKLKPDEKLITPEFIFTYSNNGRGDVSRNFHRWARNYGILDGTQPRMTLLNNWEATGFNFDEKKLTSMFADAANLGVDLFLLDDGWFANKYQRNDDESGLGDWQENKEKLPSGLGYLVKEAKKQGVKFGIWIEPEMVNPKSELYEKHPDWILKLPNRDETYFRHQLVLDLTNPEVQDFVFGIVDGIMIKNSGVAYIKWDCNRMITSGYSPYLGDNQSHLYINYVRAFYSVMERIRQKYPHLPIMLCSGGGGRTDYGALKYFTEFWPSDNTDPLERIYIQWGYSYFFPAFAVCSHVTSWGDQYLKYKIDVAMMGKMGFDIDLDKLTERDRNFAVDAVRQYDQIKDVIWSGDLYRLVSPYHENRAVLMYVDDQKSNAVVFSYTTYRRYKEEFPRVRLQGLSPEKAYRVDEIDLYPGTQSKLEGNGQVFSGDYLMQKGLRIDPKGAMNSKVFTLTQINN